MGFAHRALSWSADICVANVLYVYLSVGGTVESNRFLLPDSREIVFQIQPNKKEEFSFFDKYFGFVSVLIKNLFFIFLFPSCVSYNVTPTQSWPYEKRKEKIILKRNNKIKESELLPYVYLTGSEENWKNKTTKKKSFISCRVLFSLHVAPMCIVYCVWMRYNNRRECF